MRKERVYISGAVSGRPFGEAERHFAAEAARLQAMGFHTVNPLRMRLCVWLASRYGGERPGGGRGWGYRACLLLELLWLALTCSTIYMLSGYGRSPGARAELSLAEALSMAVMKEDGRREPAGRDKERKSNNKRRRRRHGKDEGTA